MMRIQALTIPGYSRLKTAKVKIFGTTFSLFCLNPNGIWWFTTPIAIYLINFVLTMDFKIIKYNLVEHQKETGMWENISTLNFISHLKDNFVISCNALAK